MLLYVNTDIVFQEIPDEVTLAINLSCCPNHCPGCHSPYLQTDMGTPLTEDVLVRLIAPYEGQITCICLMGGDGSPHDVAHLCSFIKAHYAGRLKTGWYSGKAVFPVPFEAAAFDYVKIGPYVASLGPLNARTTNQRLYKLTADGAHTDITSRFWRRKDGI